MDCIHSEVEGDAVACAWLPLNSKALIGERRPPLPGELPGDSDGFLGRSRRML